MPISVISVRPAAAARRRPSRRRPGSAPAGPGGGASGTSMGVIPAWAVAWWNPATVVPAHGNGAWAASLSRWVWLSVKPGTSVAGEPVSGDPVSGEAAAVTGLAWQTAAGPAGAGIGAGAGAKRAERGAMSGTGSREPLPGWIDPMLAT